MTSYHFVLIVHLFRRTLDCGRISEIIILMLTLVLEFPSFLAFALHDPLTPPQPR